MAMADKPGNPPPETRRHSSYWPAVAGGLVFLLFWQFLAGFYEPFILPAPAEVWSRLLEFIRGGRLAGHFLMTFSEALGGFGLAALTALPLSYLLARHPALDQLLTPYIVGIQAVPIVALAPLLVIWFGFGITSKLLIAALVAFFPILTNGVIGLREVDPRLKELLTIMGAGPREIFWKLEFPSALPVLFGGLKLGMTLSVIGAVVGEFSGAGKGLGYLVNFARGSFDTPLIFVALIILALLGISFYLLLAGLEYWLMPWKRQR
ncbi:NitT/TauT family transport system permease protein [Hydrogenispora ethanolica]|jgi:NitT/TauT family transport system permease protein|uniref:NitT/TauT family transport system permease protein n=1 Tax=Hydrogenispora ethanolica TaxID=1082276 RepID=A0A4R1RMB0_HYDET|nr:ABC transporter permease [Hydrogenispora ethanolica]TCL67403.1 NitT/TauT family transport system permease protein [Hydrogenispora ethanolica]